MNTTYLVVTCIRVGKNKKKVLWIISLHWGGSSFSESLVPPHFGHLVGGVRGQRQDLSDKTNKTTEGTSGSFVSWAPREDQRLWRPGLSSLFPFMTLFFTWLPRWPPSLLGLWYWCRMCWVWAPHVFSQTNIYVLAAGGSGSLGLLYTLATPNSQAILLHFVILVMRSECQEGKKDQGEETSGCISLTACATLPCLARSIQTSIFGRPFP